MSEPLPCPFCGKVPFVRPMESEVVCRNPDCTAKPCIDSDWSVENLRESAIARWNTRAPDPRAAQLREAWRNQYELFYELGADLLENSQFRKNVITWLVKNWQYKPDDLSGWFANYCKEQGLL